MKEVFTLNMPLFSALGIFVYDWERALVSAWGFVAGLKGIVKRFEGADAINNWLL
jgi:hypothetical protein